jgi:putative hydrolase of the HAD superfamily
MSAGVQAVIFDLDGVIRHYDRTHERDIEARYGLAPGSLLATAFGGETGHDFMCGRIDHDEFERRLSGPLGAGAAAEFVAMRAVVDPEAVALVRHLQVRMPVALLTNGSTRTRSELAEAGLSDAFHQVFNSAETGVPKPHVQAYLNVVEALGQHPSATAFVDDHPPNVDGAVAAGLVGHHFVGLAELRVFLGRLLD